MTERPLIRAAILAHQGGWDEILLVAGPIVVIVAVLAIVKRRVDAGLGTAGDASGDDTTDDTARDTANDTGAAGDDVNRH